MNKLIKKALLFSYRKLMIAESVFDKEYLATDVPISENVSHRNFFEYVYKLGNKKGTKILEVGSREVTGKSEARERLSQATYVGFDFYPGNNVDVVGDAHKLSSYFPEGEKFDIVYSSACFEHFAMPWIVATEIAKLLKVGGIVAIETHFAFASHERPWHFFHYTDMALRTLFSPALGFECIEAGFSNPLIGRFSSLADNDLKYKRIPNMYCHVEYLGRKVKDVENFNWASVNLNDIVGETKYPAPKHK